MANPRTIARLQARIHERAAYCLQFEISDPRAGFITVTRVELSPDVSVGKIHYSVMGGEPEKSKAAHMLASAAGYIQRQIARVLEMRRIPRLVWVYDDSVEKAADLDLLIREARARDRAINPHADETALEQESPTLRAAGAGTANAEDANSEAGTADEGTEDASGEAADEPGEPDEWDEDEKRAEDSP
jgi:ribosome-binding factor A